MATRGPAQYTKAFAAEEAAAPATQITTAVTLPAATLHIGSNVGFGSSGNATANNIDGALQTIAYTGSTSTTLTGCTGGVGKLIIGSPIFGPVPGTPQVVTNSSTIHGAPHDTWTDGPATTVPPIANALPVAPAGYVYGSTYQPDNVAYTTQEIAALTPVHGVWSKFRASIYADQAGTLVIEQSRDGVNWRTAVSMASQASTYLAIESLVIRRWVRASWTNSGGSSTTVCELDTELLGI